MGCGRLRPWALRSKVDQEFLYIWDLDYRHHQINLGSVEYILPFRLLEPNLLSAPKMRNVACPLFVFVHPKRDFAQASEHLGAHVYPEDDIQEH